MNKWKIATFVLLDLVVFAATIDPPGVTRISVAELERGLGLSWQEGIFDGCVAGYFVNNRLEVDGYAHCYAIVDWVTGVYTIQGLPEYEGMPEFDRQFLSFPAP